MHLFLSHLAEIRRTRNRTRHPARWGCTAHDRLSIYLLTEKAQQSFYQASYPTSTKRQQNLQLQKKHDIINNDILWKQSYGSNPCKKRMADDEAS